MKYLDKSGVSIIFIIVFHIVGLLGFLFSEYEEFFLSFVPFHLLLMAGILVANQKEFNKAFFLGISTVMISGFVIEVVGVATGAIFGKYTYGQTLGFKLAETPLIIGVNWFILIFSVGAVLKKYFKHQRNLKSIIGALIMVFVDVLIEPVAVKYDYWFWADSFIPLQNYIAWFFVSFALLRLYYELDFRKSNKVAATLLLSQIVFFAVLNLTLV